MTSSSRPEIDIDEYEAGVRAGNRTALGRAITLVESTQPDHRERAQDLLVRLTPHSGAASRVGITGVPGVGKSTFIDALGTELTGNGHRVAVLAVDPSSSRTGGSILGDKTRMASLSIDPNAFIRPSPASGTLGGVTQSTREAIVVVEAAGFDVVLVETVGVGQSETAVANMVDTFLVLLLARSGDSLQGIKKGVLELADVLAVNKADGPHVLDAQRAARELADVLHMLEPADPNWSPPVLTCSAVDRTGLVEVWKQVEAHRNTLVNAGTFDEKRQRQEIDWMWAMVEHQLLRHHREDPRVRERIPSIEQAVRDGSLTPTLAATELVSLATGAHS